LLLIGRDHQKREAAMRRWVAGSAIAAVLVAAGFVVAHETGARAAFGQLIVRGRVTGVDGKPVRGVKVWLNAWPATTRHQQLEPSGPRTPVTPVAWAITSAAGGYAVRVPAGPTLASHASDGVVKLGLMTGNATGSDAPTFSVRLMPAQAGRTIDLRLAPQ
jgi:hypothetical protein